MILAHLMGFLGKDPEKRITPNGTILWEVSIACTLRKNKTIWWRVVFWGDHWDKALQYFQKGKAAYIVAEITSPFETYRDKSGEIKVGYQADGKSIHFVSLGRSDEKKEDAKQDSEIREGKAPSYDDETETLPF